MTTRATRGLQLPFALIMTLVLLGVGEGFTRLLLWSRGDTLADLLISSNAPGMQIESRYVSHPFMPFALGANRDDLIIWTRPEWPELDGNPWRHEWRIRTNRWGFRGPERTLEKPPGVLRVICIGGSTTYDTSTDGETWPEKLERRLQARHPDREIQVLNLGMNAASLPFNLVQLALTGVHFDPDLVIVYPGHNDLWSGIGNTGFRPDYSHRLGHWDDSRVTIQRYLPDWTLHSALVVSVAVAIDRWRGIDYDLVKGILRHTPPADDDLEGTWAFLNHLITIDGIARAHGARFLIVTPYWGFRKNDRQERFVARIVEMADARAIPLLDAAHEYPLGDVSLLVDDVHFSEKGGDVFSAMIAEAIAEHDLLAQASRSAAD
jgi:lysophospholipase L1-like esterase